METSSTCPFKTTPDAAKDAPRIALLLQVDRSQEKDINRKAEADFIIPSIVNELEPLVGFAPDFSLFTPSYISSEESFLVVMPDLFASALRSLQKIILSTPKNIYRVIPSAKDFISRERRADTGFKWFTGTLSEGCTDSVPVIEQVMRAALTSINLKLMECTALTKKAAGGVTRAAVRIAFDINEGFDYLDLQKIRVTRLPSGFVYLRPSAPLASFYGIHAECLKSLDGRAKPHQRCTCSSAHHAGPSVSRAVAQAAQDGYRERMRKRAREAAKDPFD
jgi:hypothetical protein